MATSHAPNLSRSSLNEFGTGSVFDREDTASSKDVTVGSKYASPHPVLPASQKILSTVAQSTQSAPQHPYIALRSDGEIDIERTLVDLVLRFEKLERWVVPRLKGLEQDLKLGSKNYDQGAETIIKAFNQQWSLELERLEDKMDELTIKYLGHQARAEHSASDVVVGSDFARTSAPSDLEEEGMVTATSTPQIATLEATAIQPSTSTLNVDNSASIQLSYETGSHEMLIAPTRSTSQVTGATDIRRSRTRSSSFTTSLPASPNPDTRKQHSRSQSNVPPAKLGVGRLVKLFEGQAPPT
ncbi:hypothetical protein BT69DRAFT_550272 [Atractiella rhizophila]|nr:hypothetical protein BT69DRAFT_550272 [Atractiella rhizophila]